MKRVSVLLSALLLSLPLHAAVRAVFDNEEILRPADGLFRQVRAADVNDDGNPDVAMLVGHASGARLFVYLGNGDGTFAKAVATLVEESGNLNATDFDLADLDGDGILDVAFAYMFDGYYTRARVRRGLGDGTFGSGSLLDFSALGCREIATLALGDVTSDGLPDVVTCGVSVFPNAGDGTFGAAIETRTSASEGIDILDVNSDGHLDLFLQQGTSNQPQIFIGNGTGTFVRNASVSYPGPSAIAHLDDNGFADVAYVDAFRHDLAVVRADGAGGSLPRVSGGFVTTSGDAVIETPDMNADGRPDLVVASNGRVSIWVTNADGTPGTVTRYRTASFASRMAAADFDGDGQLDLAIGGQGSGNGMDPMVSVVRGDGDGGLLAVRAEMVSFTNPQSTTSGGFLSAGLFDVTGDGHLDAVTISGARDSLMVFPGNGDGTIAEPIETPLDSSTYDIDVVWGDWNGDGQGDVAFAAEWDDVIVSWVAQGDGTFRKAGTTHSPAISDLSSPAAGDFDGDGSQDLVWRFPQGVVLVPGNGDGTFGEPIVVSDLTTWWTTPLIAADVDNDGIDDMVLGGTILLGSAARTFTAVFYDTAGIEQAPSVVVDLNNDGFPDVVNCVYDGDDTEVIIRLGNGDASFGPPRHLTPLRYRFTNSSWRAVAGDFNADGNVDVAFDTIILLGDGAGSFAGYARLRRFADAHQTAVGDADGNGSSDLFFVDEDAAALELVTTVTTDSREIPITLALGTTPATVSAGKTFEVQATATGLGQFAATGAVVFSIGGEVAAFAEIRDGVATARVRHDSVGAKTLTAHFGGDDLYVSGGTDSVPLEVTRAVTTFGIVWMSPTPVTTRVAIRVRGDILTLAGTPPSGTVTVLVDGVVRGSASAPSFDIEIGMLALGPRTVTVQYEGDGLYLPAEKVMNVTVQKYVPAIALTADPPGPVNVGDSVMLTASFEDPTVTGEVEFYAGTSILVLLGTAPIQSGQATLTTTALPVGSIAIQAFYMGNSDTAIAWTYLYYKVVDLPLPLSPSSLYVLPPCRVVDTRGTTGPSGGPAIASAATRGVRMSGVCGIPSGAKALAVNVTVVSPAADGYLTLFPGASPWPGTSSVSYRTGKTRANNALVPLSAGGILNVFNGGPQPAHFIIDVTGYFQ